MVTEVNPVLSLFRMKDCGIPTLYIMGEEDYMFLPSIRKLVKDHVSATLEIFKECGHVVNVEKPKHFNAVAIQFIKNQSVLAIH